MAKFINGFPQTYCVRCSFVPAVVPRLCRSWLEQQECCEGTARELQGQWGLYRRWFEEQRGSLQLTAPLSPTQAMPPFPLTWWRSGLCPQRAGKKQVCECGAAALGGVGAGRRGRRAAAPSSTSAREAAEQSMTQPLRYLGRGRVILISFFVLNRKGVCG